VDRLACLTLAVAYVLNVESRVVSPFIEFYSSASFEGLDWNTCVVSHMYLVKRCEQYQSSLHIHELLLYRMPIVRLLHRMWLWDTYAYSTWLDTIVFMSPIYITE